MKLRTSNENVSPLKIEMDDHQRGLYLKRFAKNIDGGDSSLTPYYFFAGSAIAGKESPAGELFTSSTFGASKYNSRSTKASGNNSSGNSSFGSRGRFSLSPLSSVENLKIAPPAMYGTPVKAEEEVFVMDEIQVRLMSGTKSGRSSSSSSGRRQSSLSLWSPPFVKSVLNTESGNCRCDSKFQVAGGRGELHQTRSSQSRDVARGRGEHHQTRPSQSRDVARGRGQLHPTSPSMPKSEVAQEKEVLHPTSPSMTPKSESQSSKSPMSAGSSIHGPLSRLFTDVLIPSKLAPGDWSPLDDDDHIQVVLPNGSDKVPTRDEVHGYILSTVKRLTTKKRLPVFEAICLNSI